VTIKRQKTFSREERQERKEVMQAHFLCDFGVLGAKFSFPAKHRDPPNIKASRI